MVVKVEIVVGVVKVEVLVGSVGWLSGRVAPKDVSVIISKATSCR